MGKKIALLLMLVLSGCYPVSPHTVNVIHDVTGQPIGGVRVSPYYNSPLLQPRYDSAFTDADGKACLDLAWGRNYYLTFTFDNGETRRVWMPGTSGWTFRLWPEPYRRLDAILPHGYRGLLMVAEAFASRLRSEKDTPRGLIRPDQYVRRQHGELTVLDEDGITHAGILQSVSFEDGTGIEVEDWFGSKRTGIAARLIGFWNGGSQAAKSVYCIGTIAESEQACALLHDLSPARGLFDRTKTFTRNPKYDRRAI